MGVSNMTLVKISALTGMATITMGLLHQSKIKHNIISTPFYKEALKAVRSHPAAVHLLGEPIKDKSIDLGDTKANYVRDCEAHFEVPLKGSKKRGRLYMWAERPNKEAEWVLSQLELSLKDDPEKKLVIKKKNVPQ